MPHSTPRCRIDPAWSVNETLRHYPATAIVFKAFGVDACCGGALPLTAAAREAGLKANDLLDALESVARLGGGERAGDAPEGEW